MACSKTQHLMSDFQQGKEAKAMSVVDAYSPEEAVLVAKKMFQRECSGWGDEDRALGKLARQFGISAVSVKRLIKGQRKVMDVRLCKKIRLSYLTACHSLMAQLQNEIKSIEEAYGHDAVADFMDEAEVLQAKVDAAKAVAQRAYENSKGR